MIPCQCNLFRVPCLPLSWFPCKTFIGDQKTRFMKLLMCFFGDGPFFILFTLILILYTKRDLKWNIDIFGFTFEQMRIFHPVHSLVVGTNLWLNSLSKICYFFKFCRTCIKTYLKFKEFQICAYFLSGFSGCWVFINFVIFHYIDVAKQIWVQCSHLVAEIGSINWHHKLAVCIYCDQICDNTMQV